MERRCDRVMNGKEGKEENETSCAYLKETRGHGSAWHAVVGGHVAHYGAGGCCCTLGNRQREQVSKDIRQPWYNTNITPTLLWFWRDMIYSAVFGSSITIWHQNTGFSKPDADIWVMSVMQYIYMSRCPHTLIKNHISSFFLSKLPFLTCLTLKTSI